jgi:hypothetical protein
MFKTIAKTGIICLILFGHAANAKKHQSQTSFSKTGTVKMALLPADDTTSIDAIIKATYDVISGEAGPRDWSRFQRLFLPDAKMGAPVKTVQA